MKLTLRLRTQKTVRQGYFGMQGEPQLDSDRSAVHNSSIFWRLRAHIAGAEMMAAGLPNKMIGLALLFSGVALITNIISKISLRVALSAMFVFPFLAFAFSWARLSATQRATLSRKLKSGALAGVIATGAYDLSKYGLVKLQHSSYNPFEAIRTFGTLLAGSRAAEPLVYASGWTFHLLNGVCFALAFVFLFGRFGVVGALIWAMFLETFQLALYPGWLNIGFFDEFAQISVLAHLVYGFVLGVLCRLLGNTT